MLGGSATNPESFLSKAELTKKVAVFNDAVNDLAITLADYVRQRGHPFNGPDPVVLAAPATVLSIGGAINHILHAVLQDYPDFNGAEDPSPASPADGHAPEPPAGAPDSD